MAGEVIVPLLRLLFPPLFHLGDHLHSQGGVGVLVVLRKQGKKVSQMASLSATKCCKFRGKMQTSRKSHLEAGGPLSISAHILSNMASDSGPL